MSNELFSVKPEKYGSNYTQHLFEQYRMLVDSVEKTSDRRLQANNYFITINTAIFTLIGLTYQIDAINNSSQLRIMLSAAGALVSLIFFFLIRSYKQLNTGKFTVIHKIEERLPLKLYEFEWKVLGEGKDINKYYPFSHIEMLLPWAVIVIYGVLIFTCGAF